MADTVYYCQIENNYTPEFPKGIIVIPFRREYRTKINRCISYSHQVWKQGPRGGVKIIKDRTNNNCGYVTTNIEIMKQFMWIKLQAQSLANYN